MTTTTSDTNVNSRKQEMTSDLTLILDGERRDLMTFLETEGEKTYPRIGERTYRVPPVSFQPERRIQARNTADGYILDSPVETDLQKNLAEENVYGAFERLSDRLLSEGKGPLFIIINFEFDNYLNKIDLSQIPPSQKEDEKTDEDNEGNSNNDNDNNPCGDDNGGAASGNEEAAVKVKDSNDENIAEQQQIVRDELGESDASLPPLAEDEERGDNSSSAKPAHSVAPVPAPATAPSVQEPRLLCKKNVAASPIKRPRDMADRGEMDGLLLHQKAGVILLEIKAVGHNFSSLDRSVGMDPRVNISTAVTKAVIQVKRDRLVMEHVMGGIGLVDEHMTSLIALPNLSRQMLHDAYDEAGRKHLMDEYGLDLDVNFLCAEDFAGNENSGGLYAWWENVLMTNLKMEAELDIGLMKNIAYRTVGLLSTVSVWSVKEPRMEVRNLHDAAVATANCFTQLIISSQQAAVLKREDRYLYIWGTSGSGKTLLLALKGRQWLRRHRSVVILNTRLGSEGRVVGREMLRAINKSPGLPRQAECVDFDLEHDLSVLKTKLAACNLPANKPTCFLFDEVTWKSQTIHMMAMLREAYPECSIWCAGMLEEFCLPDFEKQHLEDVLRCPPWVQRVLRIIDNNRLRAQHYHTDNLKVGLATNGLRPYFVIHSHHGGDPNVETIDCVECARLVADYLKNTLKIKHPSQQQQQAQDKKMPCPRTATSR